MDLLRNHEHVLFALRSSLGAPFAVQLQRACGFGCGRGCVVFVGTIGRHKGDVRVFSCNTNSAFPPVNVFTVYVHVANALTTTSPSTVTQNDERFLNGQLEEALRAQGALASKTTDPRIMASVRMRHFVILCLMCTSWAQQTPVVGEVRPSPRA